MGKDLKKEFDKELRDIGKKENLRASDEFKNKMMKVLNELPERNNIRKKKKYKKVIGFSLIGVLTLGSVFNVYAENNEALKATFSSIKKILNIGESYYEEKGKNINLEDSFWGTTMILNDVYYDGSRLGITYEIKSRSKLDKNKKPIIFPIIDSGDRESIYYRNLNHDGEFIDDNTYVGIAEYDFTMSDLGEKVNLTFLVNDLYGNWKGRYPEKYKFQLSLDSNDIDKYVYNIEETINYNGIEFKIENLTNTPIQSILNYKSLGKIDENKEDIRGYLLEPIILDEKGIPIEVKGFNYSFDDSSNILNGSGNLIFEDIEKKHKNVLLIPALKNGFDHINAELIKDGSMEIKNENNGALYEINTYQNGENLEFSLTAKGYISTVRDLFKITKIEKDIEGNENFSEVDINCEFLGLTNEGYSFKGTIENFNKDAKYNIEFPRENYKIVGNNIKINIEK